MDTSINNQKAEEGDTDRKLVIFGRDVSQMPCFRNSFLYGISGGFGVGLLTFLATSRTRFSTHVGFGTFFTGTLVYWFSCRYQYSKMKFNYGQLQLAMKKQALYEGTDVEKEVEKKAS